MANAGRTYVLLAGVSGTVPGVTFASGTTLPLNFDAFTRVALSLANTPVFEGFLGTLDDAGRARARFDSVTSSEMPSVGASCMN